MERRVLPVVGEPVGDPKVYGEDRVFVYIGMKDKPDQEMQSSVSSLREAGQPVITILLDDLLDLGQEFFRWEIATATAGSILEINAFDQPNVQESKDNTNRLLAWVRAKGKLPEEKPSLVKDPLKTYFKETAATIPAALKKFLTQAHPGDYLALMAYIAETPATQRAFQDIRRLLQERLNLTTTLGYGPRFLHSTGQLHKGDAGNGLFIQITAGHTQDIAIPDEAGTFTSNTARASRTARDTSTGSTSDAAAATSWPRQASRTG